MKVIAVHGKAQSGKGTFISAIFNEYQKHNPNAKVVEINFADTLKEAVNLIFRIPMEDMYSPKGKEKFLPQFNTTVRDILQQFGTEGCRRIYQDIWVWNVMQKILEHQDLGYDIVGCSDLRFRNEYDALKKIDALTVKTIRVGYDGINESTHQSEIDLDDIDDWNLICKAKNVLEVHDIATEFTKNYLL